MIFRQLHEFFLSFEGVVMDQSLCKMLLSMEQAQINIKSVCLGNV